MFDLKQMLKMVIGALAACLVLAAQAITLSQSPLLTQSGSVKPNLFLIMDTSGSMDSQYLYQYGGTPDAYGYPGPGDEVSNGWGQTKSSCPTNNNVRTTSINIPCVYNTTTIKTTTISAAQAATDSAAYFAATAWSSQSYSQNALVTKNSQVWKCNNNNGLPQSAVKNAVTV